MDLESTFYILGILYFIISLIACVFIAVAVWKVYSTYRNTKEYIAHSAALRLIGPILPLIPFMYKFRKMFKK